MTVTLWRWVKVEQYFTVDERAELQKATSPAALRHGFTIDEDALRPELRAKLRFYFLELAETGGGSAA